MKLHIICFVISLFLAFVVMLVININLDKYIKNNNTKCVYRKFHDWFDEPLTIYSTVFIIGIFVIYLYFMCDLMMKMI